MINYDAEGEGNTVKLRFSLVVLLAFALFLVLPFITTQVHGSNQAPVASFTYSPPNPGPEEIMTFNASTAYDPDGYIAKYSWNFGDGNTTALNTPIITHSYPVDGNYTVELTVTDNGGLKSVSSAVIQVSTVTFFRVCYYNTLTPMPNVEVTAYYFDGTAWVKAPVSPHGLQIKYDRLTQPHEANTAEEKYRNPGYTASTLRLNSSNIGFDLHPCMWTVYFKFTWGSFVAYWPNNTVRVYSYSYGHVETHNYQSCNQAYWDPTAGRYVIRVNNIPKNGVCPVANHPIIVQMGYPLPQSKYYLSVKTDPAGITTISGEGWYYKGTNVTLTAPAYVNVSTETRYRFSYWDVDGVSQGSGVDSIMVNMNANHTAKAHYVTQYSVVFSQSGISSDAIGAIVTVNSVAKYFGDLPYTLWVDKGSSVTYSYSSTVSSSTSGKRFRLGSVAGSSSPITVNGAVCVRGNYVVQYKITFVQTGLDISAKGTVVTVNGSAKIYGDLPYEWWVDCGSTVTYSYSPIVASTISGTQFRLSSVSGSASPIHLTTPTTVIGNYVTQYSVTFTHTGLDSTATGPVVTVNGNAKEYTGLPFVMWVDCGSSVTYSYNSIVLSTTTGKQFSLTSISGFASPIAVSGVTTVTGNYKIQCKVTFDQSGVGLDFTGVILTVDGVGYKRLDLSKEFWWDRDSSHTFSFASPLTVNSTKQYAWSSTSGLSSLQSGTLTITASGSVTGNYVVQNWVTFDQVSIDSDFTGAVAIIDGVSYSLSQLPKSFAWAIGTTHTFAFQTPLLVSANTERYVWTSTTGLSTLQNGSITVSAYGSIIGHFKTQYYLTLLTNPSSITTPTGEGWYYAGSYAAISTSAYVSIDATSQYRFNGWSTADMSEITNPTVSPTTVYMDKGKTVTALYATQYKVTFGQSGVGSDFTGTVVTVDGTGYTVGTLPTATFWWDKDSTHSFSLASPLIVNVSKEYVWIYTSGLITLQNGTLTVTGYGSVTGNYLTETTCKVTFVQTGVGSDFTGTVVIIDGESYKVSDLNCSFWWASGSIHTFAFQSPLVPTFNVKRYVWNSTSDLSPLQSGSITVSASGYVIGNYKTQYYLVLATNPSGVTTPSGEGWYYAGSYAAISTSAYVSIDATSQYRFNGWSTADMSEITNPTVSPTTVYMDKGKTVTALYATQYKVTFGQSGVGSDFTGTVVTVDGTGYTVGTLPTATFWWDKDSTHSFSFASPLAVSGNVKRYVWTSMTGLSTVQSGTVTISSTGSVIGNYKTQYLLTVLTDPSGLTQPARNPTGDAESTSSWWYDSGTSVTLTAQTVSGYTFNYWDVDGSSKSSGLSPISVTVDAQHTAKAHYKVALSVTVTPPSASINLGESTTFMATPSGGSLSYSYQWYLNGNPVSGATSGTWTFTPTSSGYYQVYVIVTDSENATSQSNVASVYVSGGETPEGGFSVPFTPAGARTALTYYAMFMALFAVAICLIKRKKK